MQNRPRVGISACLVGEAVRYDGGDKFHEIIHRFIVPHVELIPICPEREAGLGIPRPPIELTQMDRGVSLRGVSDPGFDPTDAILQVARSVIEDELQLDGYIFKSRSPSCGVHHVPVRVYGGLEKTGRGVFAEAILHHYPGLCVTEEGELSTETACAAYIERLGKAKVQE